MLDSSDLARAQRLVDELERRRIGRSPWCPFAPNSEPQRLFVESDELEILYGGAAGGGKSFGLLMSALRYADRPNYNALVLRKTFAEAKLAEAVQRVSHAWLRATAASWIASEHRWTFPQGGSLQFGYLDSEGDEYRYLGGAYHFIGFDELTQFTEDVYTYLFSRLRKKKGDDIPLRMRATSNPGGIGHDWVKARFIDGDKTFIPATIKDNRDLDDSYFASLARLPEAKRRQLELGEWVRDAGNKVYDTFGEANIVAALPRPPSDPLWSFLLGIDFGFIDATAFVILGWLPDDPTVYVIESEKVERMAPTLIRDYVLRMPYSFSRIVGDTGGLGKGYAEEMRFGGVPVQPAEKTDKFGYIDLLNGEMERGKIRMLRGTNLPLIEELRGLPWDKNRRKEHPAYPNHLCDGLLYAWREARRYLREEQE